MENSILIARIFAVFFITAGAAILFNTAFYRRVMEDFVKNAALLYLGGILALFIGLLTVLFHNVWEANWALIITISGWLGIAKGIILLVFPNVILRVPDAYQKSAVLLRIHAVIALALGLFLIAKSF